MKCPYCGEQHPDQAIFCPKTGKTLSQPEVCRNCGGSLPSGVSFCPVCGFSINVETNPTNNEKFAQILKQTRVQISIILCVLFITGFLAILLNNFRSPIPAQKFTNVTTITSTILSQKKSTATTKPIVTKLTNTPRPTNTPAITENKLQPIPVDYSCPDKNKIKLQVGAFAEIGKRDVNIREEPVVPEVSDANVILVLRWRDKIQVIGGPTCSHDGTWWKVKTESGRVGWAREISKGNVLLIRTDE